MLIISKFIDYYDASVGQGVDKTIVYNREQKVIMAKAFLVDNYLAGSSYLQPYEWLRDAEKALHEWRIVGFCGKTYVLLIERTKADKNDTEFKNTEYYYGEEGVERVYKGKKKTWRWRPEATIDFVKQWHNQNFEDFFIENQTPIFIVEPISKYSASANVTVNTSLRDIKFFKLFDSFQAFQEIQMFISGVMGTTEKETIKISDKEKIKQHGFDNQWSFRNPDPPKRKMK